jgi:hypothetical protein
LFAFVCCLFSTPTEISFQLTLGWRVLERSVGVGADVAAATNLTFSHLPSLLCSSISAVCLNLLLELESNRHRICTEKTAAAALLLKL